MDKKILGIILAAIICINCLSVASFADVTEDLDDTLNIYGDHIDDAQTISGILGNREEAFIGYLLSELSQCKTEINIYQYGIPVASFRDLCTYIVYCIPEAFNIKLSRGMGGTSLNGYVYEIELEYNCTKVAYNSLLEQFEEKAEQYLKGIKGNNSLTDYQKALLLHDRLIANCEYDFENTSHCEDAYGAIVNEKAVCQGYAVAYGYLLKQAGIESYVSGSVELNHAWNIVKINNKLYYVDPTWDDPTNCPVGTVNHDHFLVSYSVFRESHKKNGNYVNDYDVITNSTDLDDYFWHDCDTEFQLINNNIYYFSSEDGGLKKWNLTGDDTILVQVPDQTWTTNDGAYWIGYFSKLSSDGTDLFYSTNDAIYLYDLSNNSSVPVFYPEDLGDGNWIYGFKYDNGNLIYEIFSEPVYSEGDTRLISQTPYVPHTHLVYEEDGYLYYLVDNQQSDFSGVLLLDGKYRVIYEGCIDSSEDDIVYCNDLLYHVVDGGVAVNEEPALHDYYGTLYYFENGQVCFDDLIFDDKDNGVRYLVISGRIIENDPNDKDGIVYNFGKDSYLTHKGRIVEEESRIVLGGIKCISKNGVVTYALLEENSAQLLTDLIGMILETEEINYFYDFSRDDTINILDLVCAKKEIACLESVS